MNALSVNIGLCFLLSWRLSLAEAEEKTKPQPKPWMGPWQLEAFSCGAKDLTNKASIANSKLKSGDLKGFLQFGDGKGTFALKGQFNVLFLSYHCEYSGAMEFTAENSKLLLKSVEGKETSKDCPLPIFPFKAGEKFKISLENGQLTLDPEASQIKNSGTSQVNESYCEKEAQLEYQFKKANKD